MSEDKETPKPQPDHQTDPRRTTGSGNSEPYSTLGSSPYPAFAAAPPSHPYPAFGRYSPLQSADPLPPGEIQAITAQREAREKAQRAQCERAEKIKMAFELTVMGFGKMPGEGMAAAAAAAVLTVKDLLEAFPE